ncbi:MAG TPA: hypothetical protein VFT91_03690 [Dehalococcoidia bacterium]|nr:hypothetical protein [Dehalococcoidia bacterium]
MRRAALILLTAVVLPAFLFAAAACGGGSSGSPTPASTPSASPTETEPSPPAGPPLPGPSLDLAAQPPVSTVLGIDSQDFAEGVPSLASGDFNADGYADVLIGAPLADGPDNTRDGAGEAYVILGRPDPPQQIDLTDKADLIIYGAAPDDGLGYSVLAADVNGDGTDDVLVGAPGVSGTEDPRTDQGQVYVFFGAPDLGGTRDIAQAAAPVTISGAEGFSRVGHAIASGDVNADGISDIVVGAPFAGRFPNTPPGSERTEVGEVYVLFGRHDLSGYFSVVFDQQNFTIGGLQPFGQFGASVAAGDVNGDGVDDIIVGAPQSDGPDGAPDSAGLVYVFFGAAGLTGRVSLTERPADFTVLGAGERHSLGFPLISADLNADGIADIAVGARLATAPGSSTLDTGAVYVLFGRRDLGGTLNLASAPADVTTYGAQASQLIPSSLASGDLNGDGAADLLIGSGTASGPGSRAAAGVAYVVLGGPAFAAVDLAAGGQDLAVSGIHAGDSLGSAVIAAAVTGARPHLVLLASAADRPDGARSDTGAIYFVLPPPFGG